MPEQPEAYLAWILDRIERTPTEERAVADAHGCALAADVHSRLDLPLWDASAMDGYALRSEDTAAATEAAPAELRVLGEIAAGSGDDPALPEGCAIRIMTGAPVPGDADAVVPVEATAPLEAPAEGSERSSVRRRDARRGAWAAGGIAVPSPVVRGANVRRRAEDVRAGTPIAFAGEALDAVRVSAIAAAGVGTVPVRRPPSIAVVSTGSELRGAGGALARGQIPESNSLLIGGLLAEAGFAPAAVAHRPDDADALAAFLAELAARHDVVITTGGVGPGLHDVVRIALEREPEIRALRVAVRPGQPQCSGRHSAGAFVFALPGNPVSAAVSFELFVRPALRALAGHARLHRRRLLATASTSWEGRAGRLQVLPVRIEETPQGLSCAPVVHAGRVSHSVGGHGAATGYALVEAERGGVREGETVVVIETGQP